MLRDGDGARAERAAEPADWTRGSLSFGQVCSSFKGNAELWRRSPVQLFTATLPLRLPGTEGDSRFSERSRLPRYRAASGSEASMLVPGQELRMELKHSLVGEKVLGGCSQSSRSPDTPTGATSDRVRSSFGAVCSIRLGNDPYHLEMGAAALYRPCGSSGIGVLAPADGRMALQVGACTVQVDAPPSPMSPNRNRTGGRRSY